MKERMVVVVVMLMGSLSLLYFLNTSHPPILCPPFNPLFSNLSSPPISHPHWRKIPSLENINQFIPPTHLGEEYVAGSQLREEKRKEFEEYARHMECAVEDSHYQQIWNDMLPFIHQGIEKEKVEMGYKYLSNVIRISTLSLKGWDSGTITYQGKKDEEWENHARVYANTFIQIAQQLSDLGLSSFPDIDVVINMMDEPRVLVDTKNKKKNTEVEKNYTDKPTEVSYIPRAVWEGQPRIPERFFAQPVTTRPFEGFPTLLEQTCDAPEGYLDIVRKHSAVFSPVSSELIHRLVPILSRTKLVHCMSDILFPDYMFLYWNPMEIIENNELNPWSDKKDILYWRGSATGGIMKTHNWRNFHRVQFVMNTYNRSEFDTGITAVPHLQGYADVEVHQIIPATGNRPFSDNWKYKYIMDMDGNTYTQSFKQFMLANSLLFKMNPLFPEYWSYWVKPWTHYIPVDLLSNSKDDFLSDLEEKLEWAKTHEEESKKIAEASTELMKTKMKFPNDIYCYIYRLALEYSQLMTYSPPLLLNLIN